KKMPEKLQEHQENAFLSYQLATIKTDVPLSFTPESIHQAQTDEQRLRELFVDLEFKSWVAELTPGQGEVASSSAEQGPDTDIKGVGVTAEPVRLEMNCITITDELVFAQWMQKLAGAELFAFDTETTSLNAMTAHIVGVSFAVEPGEAAYVPCGHDYMGAPEQLPLDWVLEKLKPMLEDPA